MGSILFAVIIILFLVADLIEDVKNEIPFSLLVIETMIIFIMAYLEKDAEDKQDKWIYVGAFFFALIAITYLIFNYNLQ